MVKKISKLMGTLNETWSKEKLFECTKHYCQNTIPIFLNLTYLCMKGAHNYPLCLISHSKSLVFAKSNVIQWQDIIRFIAKQCEVVVDILDL